MTLTFKHLAQQFLAGAREAMDEQGLELPSLDELKQEGLLVVAETLRDLADLAEQMASDEPTQPADTQWEYVLDCTDTLWAVSEQYRSVWDRKANNWITHRLDQGIDGKAGIEIVWGPLRTATADDLVARNIPGPPNV